MLKTKSMPVAAASLIDSYSRIEITLFAYDVERIMLLVLQIFDSFHGNTYFKYVVASNSM